MRKSKYYVEKLTSWQIVFLISLLIINLLYLKTYDVIINYPYKAKMIAYILCLIFFCGKNNWMYRKMTKRYALTSKYIVVIAIIIVVYFASNALLVPFNYYIIYSAEKSPTEKLNCEITGVSVYSQNRNVYYKLNDKTNIVYGYSKIMDTISKSKSFHDYTFVASVKKGIFDTYILKYYYIKRK